VPWLLVEASGLSSLPRVGDLHISRLDDVNMREDQLANGMILKMSVDLRSALPKMQFYSWMVVKPSVRFRRQALVPDTCAFRRLPGPGARSRSSTTCFFETPLHTAQWGARRLGGHEPRGPTRWRSRTRGPGRDQGPTRRPRALCAARVQHPRGPPTTPASDPPRSRRKASCRFAPAWRPVKAPVGPAECSPAAIHSSEPALSVEGARGRCRGGQLSHLRAGMSAPRPPAMHAYRSLPAATSVTWTASRGSGQHGSASYNRRGARRHPRRVQGGATPVRHARAPDN